MTARALALITSVALLAPSFATEARAQRSGGARPPVVQQGPDRNGRDFWDGRIPDLDRNARIRFERERERLAAAAFRDGYEAGFRAGRDRRRFDFAFESRFRSGDRGYQRDFGPRDRYNVFYREAFRDGYGRGYADARRNDRRWPPLTIRFGFGR